jgi:hypothetical protein
MVVRKALRRTGMLWAEMMRLRYLVATKTRSVVTRKLRGL